MLRSGLGVCQLLHLICHSLSSLSHACSTELVRPEAMLQAARILGLLRHARKTPETPGHTAHDPMGHARHSCVSIQVPDTSRLQKPG